MHALRPSIRRYSAGRALFGLAVTASAVYAALSALF